MIAKDAQTPGWPKLVFSAAVAATIALAMVVMADDASKQNDLAQHIPILWGKADAGCSIGLQSKQASFYRGETVDVTLYLRNVNTGGEEAGYVLLPSETHTNDLLIDARKMNEEYKGFTEAARYDAAVRKKFADDPHVRGSFQTFGFQPGKAYSRQLCLGALLDLTREGDYTIRIGIKMQLPGHANGDLTELWTDELTLTIQDKGRWGWTELPDAAKLNTKN